MSISTFRTLAFVAFAIITVPLFSQNTCEVEGLFVVDDCGVLHGDNSTCLDACGVINGDNSTCADDCGVPNGDNSTCLDACGVPNGDNSTCLDACGVPNGDNSTCLDDCGVLNGDNSTCADACGVPNGDNSTCLDACGVPNGDNSTCLDACGVPNGDNSTCLDYCGVPNGDNSTCPCVDVTFDGYSYATVRIGGQCWFSENLRSDHYRDGAAIPGNLDNGAWSTTTDGAQYYYNNEAGNLSEYGRLYNWYAVDDARGLCPSGWHVPSDAEYTTLTDFLGGLSVAGGKMKETGTAHWGAPNLTANNSSGFTGFSSGYRHTNGSFGSLLFSGYFWSSSPSSANSWGNAWYRALHAGTANVGRSDTGQRTGYAVRCVED
jgi:uncharacterized protein (TIGR02145 family)